MLSLPCAKVAQGNGTSVTQAHTTFALQKNQGAHSYFWAEKNKVIAKWFAQENNQQFRPPTHSQINFVSQSLHWLEPAIKMKLNFDTNLRSSILTYSNLESLLHY